MFRRKKKTPELTLKFTKAKDTGQSQFVVIITDGEERSKTEGGGILARISLDTAAEIARTINQTIAGISSIHRRR